MTTYRECKMPAGAESWRWDVPPQNQGQIVTVAYSDGPTFDPAPACHGSRYQRVFDASDRTVVYYEADEPCCDGCPGYDAFVVDREPSAARLYLDGKREIQRCDECERFETDDQAYAQWVADGKPDLDRFYREMEKAEGLTRVYVAIEYKATLQLETVRDALEKALDEGTLQVELAERGVDVAGIYIDRFEQER